nr:uncharacterized protein LOC123759080 isoform X2 [Procambarus clarkii]
MSSVTDRSIEPEKCSKQGNSSHHDSGGDGVEGGPSTRTSCQSPTLFDNLEDASQKRKAVNHELHRDSTFSLYAKKYSHLTQGNGCSEELEGQATKSAVWSALSSLQEISNTAKGSLVNRNDNKNGEELASTSSVGPSACHGGQNCVKFLSASNEDSDISLLAKLDLAQGLASPTRPHQIFQCHSGSQNLQMQCMQEGGVEIKKEILYNYTDENGIDKDLYSNTLRERMPNIQFNNSPTSEQNNDNHYLGANEGCQQDDFDSECHDFKSENINAFSNNCAATIHSDSEALLSGETSRLSITLPVSSGIPSSVRPLVKINNVQEYSVQNKMCTQKHLNEETFPPVEVLIQKEYLEREKRVLLEQSECIELQRLNILCSFSGDSGNCSKLLEVNELLKTEMKEKMSEINNKLIKLNKRLSLEGRPDTVASDYKTVKCPKFASNTRIIAGGRGFEFSNSQRHMDLHPVATVRDNVAERNDPLLKSSSTVELIPRSYFFRPNCKRKWTDDESANMNTDYTVVNDNIGNLHERRSKKIRKDLGNARRTPVLKEEFLQRAAQVNWCRLCNMFFPSIVSYVDHLATLEHLQRRKINDGSWLRKVPQVESKHIKQEEPQDVYGVEYLDCVPLFFCNLCEVFIWDREEVMFHPSCSQHVENFKRHVSENVQRELNFFQRKTAAYKNYCEEQELESDATNKENEIPPEHHLGSDSFITANTLSSSLNQNVIRTSEAEFLRPLKDKGTVPKAVSIATETIGRTDVNTNAASFQVGIKESAAEAKEYTAAVCLPSANVLNRSDISVIATDMKRPEEADESITQSLSCLTKDATNNKVDTRLGSSSVGDITNPVISHECTSQSFTERMLPLANTFVCNLNKEVDSSALAKKNLIVKPHETIVTTCSLPGNDNVSSVYSTRGTLCPVPSLREVVKYEGDTFNSNLSDSDKLELVESTEENTVSYSSVSHDSVEEVLKSENTLTVSTPVTEVVKDEMYQPEDQMDSVQTDNFSEGVVVVKEETTAIRATSDVTTNEEDSISCIPNFGNNIVLKNELDSHIIASNSLEKVGSGNSKAKGTVVNIEPCKGSEDEENTLPASAEINRVSSTSINAMKRKKVQRIKRVLHTEPSTHFSFQPRDTRVEEDMESLRNLMSTAENSQVLQASKLPKDSLVTSSVSVRRPNNEGCENIRILRVLGKPYRKPKKFIRFEDDLRLVCENVKPEILSPEKSSTAHSLQPIRQNVEALERLSNSAEKADADKNKISSKATCKFIQIIKSASKTPSCEVSLNQLKAPASSVIIKRAECQSAKVTPPTSKIITITNANCSEGNIYAHSVDTTENNANFPVSKVKVSMVNNIEALPVSKLVETLVTPKKNLDALSVAYKCDNVSSTSKNKTAERSDVEELISNAETEDKPNHSYLDTLKRSGAIQLSHQPVAISGNLRLAKRVQPDNLVTCGSTHNIQNADPSAVCHRTVKTSSDTSQNTNTEKTSSDVSQNTHTEKTSSVISQKIHTEKNGPNNDPCHHENVNTSPLKRPRISLSEYRKRISGSKNFKSKLSKGFRSALGEYRKANNKKVENILKKNYQELQRLNQGTSDHNSCHLHSEEESESNNLSSSCQNEKNILLELPSTLDFLLSPSSDENVSITDEMTPQSLTRSKSSHPYLDLSFWRPEPEQLSQVAVAAHIAEAAVEACKPAASEPEGDVVLETKAQAVKETCVTAASKPKFLTASEKNARKKINRDVWNRLKVLLVGDSRLENFAKTMALKDSTKKVVCIPRLEVLEALSIIFKEMTVETYNAVFIMVGHADITSLKQVCGCKNPYEYLTMMPCSPEFLLKRVEEVNTNLKALYPNLYVLWGSLYPIEFLSYNNSLALSKRLEMHDCNLNMFSYVQSIKAHNSIYNEFNKKFVKFMKIHNIPFIDLKNYLRSKRVRALKSFTSILCDGVHVKTNFTANSSDKIRRRIISYFIQIENIESKND